MTPAQAEEIKRLASLWANARVLRSRKRKGELPLWSERALDRKAADARDAFYQAVDAAINREGEER